jgi:alpha-tubulin suppressor-like RCC1 family protein
MRRWRVVSAARGKRASGWLLVVVLVAVGAAVRAPAASSATLTVRISGLPEGRTARVTVRGPDGYIRSLGVSRTLRGLHAGRYRTSAGSVRLAEFRYSPAVDRPTVRLRSTGRATVRVRYTFSGPSSNAVAISAGGIHACALRATGAVECWGYNARWQLGTVTDSYLSSTPVQVDDLTTGATAVEVGGLHSCALSGDAPLCWGGNFFGQLGDGSLDDTFEATPPTGLDGGIAKISAGGHHTCAVTTDGAALCWGLGSNGRLGHGTEDAKLTPVAVSGLASGVESISAGSAHTCAVTTAGAALCWGYNLYGQLGNGTQADSWTPVQVQGLSSGVVAINAGERHTCALLGGGGVRCWGAGDHGQLGNGEFPYLPLTTPVAVSGLSGVTSLSVGDEHACVVTKTGVAKCWGRGDRGQVGDGQKSDRSKPVVVDFLSSGVTAIAAGGLHSCAVTVTGAALCWGSDEYGELGNGWMSGGGAVPWPYVVIGFGLELPT